MKLGEIFKNGLILQAGKPIRIFGKSDGEVSLSLAGKTITASGGSWTVEFPAMEYGGPYILTASGDGEELTVSDIYIGEVILFSGQSNIQFRMNEAVTPDEFIADDDMLRIFVSERPEEGEPLHPSDGWIKASRETIGKWSALAYLTGFELRKKGIPAVGVVACSQGASVIQSWIDDKVIVGSELDLPDEKRHCDSKNPTYSRWNAPGMLYHFMLERLMPFSFGRVVWYQGESNSSVYEGEIYDKLLAMMIGNWRKSFVDGSLGFIVVQIADFIHTGDKNGWKAVQDAQLRAQDEIPGARTVVSADICENDMIHPVTKWKLAKRISEIY